MILAIDPGRRPGYALLDPGTLIDRRWYGETPLVVACWQSLPTSLPAGVELTAVVVEGQWLQGAKRKAAILALALEAGWQLAAAQLLHGGAGYIVPVSHWRGALELGRATKKVAQNRCTSVLTVPELAHTASTSPTRRGDVLDAILIGWGWAKEPTKKWSPPP